MKELDEKIDLTIGESTVINGNVESKGSIRIDGALNGDVNCGGMVVIGDKGSVSGNVIANKGVIGGKVIGNLDIKDYLELNGTAHIQGDINSNILQIDKGAIFNGQCTMGKKEKKIQQ